MEQKDLARPTRDSRDDQPLIPARMVNEFTYCPRLAYLEWVQGEWAANTETVDGSHRHRRVDKAGGKLPEAGQSADDERIHARSVTLSSERLGLIAKLDLVEGGGDSVSPVDYKRGKRPHVDRGAYDPERVQLCVQGMLLEEHGYECNEGVLYYVASKERVRVPFDAELRELTRLAVDGLRTVAAGGAIPPPLHDSPKCPRCSLVGICLPDEVNYLQRAEASPRPLFVARDEALPLYIQQHGAKVGKRGEELEIRVEDSVVAKARLPETSQVVLFGGVYITTPCLHELMWRDIPVTWHSFGGWFMGHTQGNGHKNVELRTAQYRSSFDDAVCLRIARGLVAAKIQNCRTLLRRNWKDDADTPDAVVRGLKNDFHAAQKADSIESLLGIEGAAAARYFGVFRGMLKLDTDPRAISFDFSRRNRRPPEDPVNALLSFAYSLLVRTWHVTLTAVGFDAFRGFYHQPRYGRPALALDLMEPFRPLVADSSVVQAINNGEVKPNDFVRHGPAVSLTSNGRKSFIATFERRMAQEIAHPLFGYRVSYRRLLELQARLFGRYLLGELPDYPNFTTR